MIWKGCSRPLAVALTQAVGPEEIVALVAANGELILELATTQFVEFAHACFGEVLTQLCGIKDDTRSLDVLFFFLNYILVITLSAYAKIIAEKGDVTPRGRIRFLALRQSIDYLASRFFRMGILNIFSAKSIMVELAKHRNSDSERAFLRRLISAS